MDRENVTTVGNSLASQYVDLEDNSSSSTSWEDLNLNSDIIETEREIDGDGYEPIYYHPSSIIFDQPLSFVFRIFKLISSFILLVIFCPIASILLYLLLLFNIKYAFTLLWRDDRCVVLPSSSLFLFFILYLLTAPLVIVYFYFFLTFMILFY